VPPHDFATALEDEAVAEAVILERVSSSLKHACTVCSFVVCAKLGNIKSKAISAVEDSHHSLFKRFMVCRWLAIRIST
jgi:hypothetical protein